MLRTFAVANLLVGVLAAVALGGTLQTGPFARHRNAAHPRPSTIGDHPAYH